MAKKVLVFESDAAFAGELRSELGKYGCATTVVDDGNVGLQQAASDKPDLILLSIELPRMNGFSVCNKLKKDPALKDVPLIIMSSESSEETFEQHRKLRTRAEDYVHKPIAFGELLQHIQQHVQLGTPTASAMPPSDAMIVIDDEIAVSSTDYVAEDDGAMTQIGQRPDFLPPPKAAAKNVDADVDRFAEDAFDALTGPKAAPKLPSVVPPAVEVQNGRTLGASPPPPQAAPAAPAPPPMRRQPTMPPRPSVDQGDVDRVRADLEKAKSRANELEKDLASAKADISRLQDDKERGSKSDAESQRMQREIDELKVKLAAGPKTGGGGISSREFLDLREAMNKKDKEILSLRESYSKKDREIVEATDKSLALERTKADLDDKILLVERELDDAKEKIEALTADKDLAKKASEDFKARFERTKGEVETKTKEIADLRAKHGEELAQSEARHAALKEEQATALAREQAEMQQRLDQAEASRKADLDQASRDREAAVAEAKEQAATEKTEAMSAREAELKSEADGKLASLHRAHQGEMQRSKDEAARVAAEELSTRVAALTKEREDELAAQAGSHATKLAALEGEHTEKVSAIEKERDARIASLEAEHREKIASVENDRDARIAALESKAARELSEAQAAGAASKADADERIAKLEMDLSAVRGELETITKTKSEGDATNEAKIAELTESVTSLTAARERLDDELATTGAKLTVTEAGLAATKQDLAEASSKLDAATKRADKAFAKWEADRASLERAKDALAVALSQIDEAEGRPISDS
jgi:CheY-like chemotaxis protein